MRPFAITPNKLYLAPGNQVAFYRRELRECQSYYFEKTSPLFGADVDIYGTLACTFSVKKHLIEGVKRTPLAPYARALRARLQA